MDPLMNIPVPIVGQAKTYKCRRDHKFQSAQPFVMGMRDYNTGPMCPFCHIDWMRAMFGVEEVKAEDEPLIIAP